LGTGTTNTINIGTSHTGTGASTIAIGKTGVGTTTIGGYETSLGGHISTSQTTAINTPNATIYGTYIYTSSSGDGGWINTDTFGTNSHIDIRSTGTNSFVQLSANGTNATLNLIGELVVVQGGSITLGTSAAPSVKARSANATVAGDNDLTLATKGYVDAAVTPLVNQRWIKIDTGGTVTKSHVDITAVLVDGGDATKGYTVTWGFSPTYVLATALGARYPNSGAWTVIAYATECQVLSLVGQDSVIVSNNFAYLSVPDPGIGPTTYTSANEAIGFMAMAY
jgi:hypothetical protein